MVAHRTAVGIPARLYFSDVCNHLLPRELIEFVGTNIMAFHRYADLSLNNRWIKANPALDIDLCRVNDILPFDLSGDRDAPFSLVT